MIKIPHLLPTDSNGIRENVEASRNAFRIPKRVNKYQPHQGNKERLRRLMKIYEKHPMDCPCKSCELVDIIVKERNGS